MPQDLIRLFSAAIVAAAAVAMPALGKPARRHPLTNAAPSPKEIRFIESGFAIVTKPCPGTSPAPSANVPVGAAVHIDPDLFTGPERPHRSIRP